MLSYEIPGITLVLRDQEHPQGEGSIQFHDGITCLQMKCILNQEERDNLSTMYL